ncbi:MAG: energy-coupling factor ABC transporter ATP-binding protein [Oscillospiraceae bacterium]|nr:energy-coupling factor ABC transporter ATP-binding protein [Oscillospiraceae bacterium]
MKNESQLIEIKDASFVYDGETMPVWKHLSCCFKKNCVNLILGPSGCGKSTLLCLLDGLIPDAVEGKFEGEVLYYGKASPSGNKRTGMVFQDPESQFCTFTVEDEIAFGLENRAVPREAISARIDEALAAVGIPELRDRQLNQLSGGQKQKVAIASILAVRPEVLLMDEPTANLDAKGRKSILNLLKKLAKQDRLTLILVEHNTDELFTEVEHIVVLDEKGAVRLQGETEKVLSELRENQKFEALAASVMDNGLVPLFKKSEPSSNRPVLSLKDVGFSYPDGGKVLDGIDMEINRGDFAAIVGFNGAGKSTLLNVIFKVLHAKYGEIRINGKNQKTLKKRELYQECGLVFQNPELQFVTGSVWDELMFSLKKAKLPQADKDSRVSDILARFSLLEYRDRSPFLLSQGQKRRLSVATMLLTGQNVLFLDEPTFGQDFENRKELMQLLCELNSEGLTIVMVTHDMSLVRGYANRVFVLDNGKIIYDGTPDGMGDYT